METSNSSASFPTGSFAKTIIANTIWINLSEVFRYFAFIMPMMRAAFPDIENVAPMNAAVFGVWGLWDTILVVTSTGFIWLYLERFGYGKRNALIAGFAFWMSVFVVLWLGLFNMNLATPKILAVALPLSFFEIAIAAMIVNWGMRPNVGTYTQRSE